MSARDIKRPRQRLPDLERDFTRSPALGFEPPETGTVRCLAHGFPTPLARWHVHDDYELHLITATSGKTFVGTGSGRFNPATWYWSARGFRTTGCHSMCPRAVSPSAIW
jgi:hypothetical protein